MGESDRWDYLVQLDDELLQGGVILSEWCAFIVREADTAFAKGANLAAIIMSLAGIETYLRSEYATSKRPRLYELIESAPIEADLKNDVHQLRQFRNRFVHIDEPWEDGALLDTAAQIDKEVANYAHLAVRLLRRILYGDQWI